MAFVDNHGFVVTVGNPRLGSAADKRELVIYRDGKVIRRYSRDDLLSKYGQPQKARHAAGRR